MIFQLKFCYFDLHPFQSHFLMNLQIFLLQQYLFLDISEHISCSKVFTSKYGKGFGIVGPLLGEESPFNVANGLNGIFFYIILAFLGKRFVKSFSK